MKQANGNLFGIDCDAICITTNGYVKTNGNAVMGKGCALEASKLLPTLPQLLGASLRKHGNHVSHLITANDTALLSFPVKPESVIFNGHNVVKHMAHKYKIDHKVYGCFAVADIHLIEQSAKELVQLTDLNGWTNVILPRPGCGHGELQWADVEQILDNLLDDRFTCLTY
jgi:hypothetical protein